MLDGFRYLAGNQVVLMSFVVDLIAMILGMPRALFPQMAHRESFGGPVEGGTTMALLAAAMSAGAVAGGCSRDGCRRFGGRALRSSSRSSYGAQRWSASALQVDSHTATPAHCSGFHWRSWLLAVQPTWCLRPSGRLILQQAASDELRGRLQGVFTVVVAGGPRLADAVHGRPQLRSARRSPPPGVADWWWWAWWSPHWSYRRLSATAWRRATKCDRRQMSLIVSF